MLEKPFERFRYKMQQGTCLELSSEKPRSLTYFLENLYHFVKFLNIVAGSVLGIEFITMTSFQNVETIQDGKPYYSELNLIIKKENFPFQNLNSNHHTFLIKYELAKDNFEMAIKNWFLLKNKSMIRIIDLLYECIENKNKIRAYLFLAISQANEGFYRIDKKQRNHDFDKVIRIMLKDNIDRIRFLNFQILDIDKVTREIKELRNDLTHIGKFEKPEINQSEIHFFTNLLKNILSIALLKKIGISESEINVTQ